MSVLVLILSAGCSDKNSKFKAEYMEGCVASGTSKSICACVYDKMGNDIQKLQVDASLALTGEYKTRVYQSIMACMAK